MSINARVCLCMIVKNESHVIERCLQSVRPFINSWVVSDTGSTDGTQEIVKRILADLPGELIERPWVDFAHNRNEALSLAAAYGEYALTIDADEVLECDEGFSYGELIAPGYMLEVRNKNLHYQRTALIRLDGKWEWKGVLHEALVSKKSAGTQKLSGLYIRPFVDGARSQRTDAEKYGDDSEILRQALLKEPESTRYAFYLAQSLRDAGKLEEALDAYNHRISMGGWEEELYFSHLQVATLKERLDYPYLEVLSSYYKARSSRKSRAEPLYELARYCRAKEKYHIATVLSSIALAIPYPESDILFIDAAVYAWKLKDEIAISSYYCGDYATSKRLCEELLASRQLPSDQVERVRHNLEFAIWGVAQD